MVPGYEIHFASIILIDISKYLDLGNEIFLKNVIRVLHGIHEHIAMYNVY